MTTKKTFILGFTAMLATSFASCELETSDNGHLDGLWHLERVDTLATGGTADYSRQYVFWGAQYKLIYIYDTQHDEVGNYYLRFQQTSDSLHITKAFINNWHEDNPDVEQGGDIPVYDVNPYIQHFGINELPEGFAKEKLSGSWMILRSKTLRLTFKRF